MHVDLMRERGKAFPAVPEPDNVTSLRVWHCKYISLAALERFANLQELAVAGFPDATLDMLSGLRNLRWLKIVHLPGVDSLAPLAGLGALESLSLATSPAWDAAGKLQSVASLEPLSGLSSLRHLELFGVVPVDGGLAPLHGLKLASARLSKYPAEAVARFFEQTKAGDTFNPPASFED